jgi:chromosome segregation ATPase
MPLAVVVFMIPVYGDAQNVDAASANLKAAQVGYEEAQENVTRLVGALRKATGRTDVSPEAILRAATRLEDELESLELNAAAGEARLEAITRTIAEVTAKGTDTARSDPVAAELATVVAAREEGLAVTEKLYKQGAASQEATQAARVALADARARLLERRQVAVAQAGGGAGALADWNRELLNLAHDAQERKARIKYLGDRLKTLRDAQPLLDQLAAAHEAKARAEARLAAATRGMEKLSGSAP